MIPGQVTGTKAIRAPCRAGLAGAASLGLGYSHPPGKSHRSKLLCTERAARTHEPGCHSPRLMSCRPWQGVSYAGRGFCALFTRLALGHVWEDTGQPRL